MSAGGNNYSDANAPIPNSNGIPEGFKSLDPKSYVEGGGPP
jgi:hypothetical protein